MPDAHYWSAAIGWLELGNLTEARAELDHISPAGRDHPDVLEVRWLICAEQKRWDEALEAARAVLSVAPKRSSAWLHQAYALRRVPQGSLQQAWDALLPAYQKFPKESTIPYNLACYACQMDQLDTARTWFKRALVIGGKKRIQTMALADPDLKPLWGEIKEL
jgi:tetratricopeptide (TPR) repeat protein